MAKDATAGGEERKKRPGSQEPAAAEQPLPVVVVPSAPVRTSSCTKEVDAILIQCGRLSRSSSGAGRAASSEAAGGHRKRRSGSKRSYDFDQDARSGGGADKDWERQGTAAVSRPSPHQGSLQRKWSGSRRSGGGGSGSWRASRSPGRRTDVAAASAATAGSSGGGEHARQQPQSLTAPLLRDGLSAVPLPVGPLRRASPSWLVSSAAVGRLWPPAEPPPESECAGRQPAWRASPSRRRPARRSFPEALRDVSRVAGGRGLEGESPRVRRRFGSPAAMPTTCSTECRAGARPLGARRQQGPAAAGTGSARCRTPSSSTRWASCPCGRACVLARRWRHLLRSLPCLRVVDVEVLGSVYELTRFVNRLLLLRDPGSALDGCEFDLRGFEYVDPVYVDLWMVSLPAREKGRAPSPRSSSPARMVPANENAGCGPVVGPMPALSSPARMVPANENADL